jgi:hypothetical protein
MASPSSRILADKIEVLTSFFDLIHVITVASIGIQIPTGAPLIDGQKRVLMTN